MQRPRGSPGVAGRGGATVTARTCEAGILGRERRGRRLPPCRREPAARAGAPLRRRAGAGGRAGLHGMLRGAPACRCCTCSAESGPAQPLALLVRGALCLSAGVWGGAGGGRRLHPAAGGSVHGARRSPGDARRSGLLQYVLGPLELSVGRQGRGHRIIVTVLMKGFKLAW